MVEPTPLTTANAVPRCDDVNFLCRIGPFHDGAATVASFASTIAYCVGLIGIVVAVIQYKSTEKWKRAEFISKALQDFRGDEQVDQVIGMMDYWGNEIDIGTKNSPNMVRVFHTPGHVGHEESETATDIETALRFHGTPGLELTTADLAIRDRFDTVLSYFEQFEIYIRKKLCTQDDIEPYISYHIKLFNGQLEHSRGYHATLFTYIVLYQFDLAQRFLSRFRQTRDITEAVQAAEKRREIPASKAAIAEPKVG